MKLRVARKIVKNLGGRDYSLATMAEAARVVKRHTETMPAVVVLTKTKKTAVKKEGAKTTAKTSKKPVRMTPDKPKKK